MVNGKEKCRIDEQRDYLEEAVQRRNWLPGFQLRDYLTLRRASASGRVCRPVAGSRKLGWSALAGFRRTGSPCKVQYLPKVGR